MSAFSISVCELTETYSPAAIESAPATKPAIVAKSMGSLVVLAAAIPTAKLEIEIIPSFLKLQHEANFAMNKMVI
jgi:hypothetical protein